MKVLIAAGIYPPEIGGPAPYAKGVKESLERSGHDVPLVLFAPYRRYPIGLRHVLYAIALFRAARGASAIFAFDTFSVGFPAALVGMLRRIPVVIRVGGDVVWEQYVRRTGAFVPLPDFYASMPPLVFKERLTHRLAGFVFRHAILACNTRWLARIVQNAYALTPERVRVVENVIGERMSSTGDDGTLLMAGREVKLKRASIFRRAFARVRERGGALAFVEQTLSREVFFERLRAAHAFINPDIADFAPNSVIDSIRCGKPFLLTKYCGYAERFSDLGVIVDTNDEADVARGIEALADKHTYQMLCERITAYTEVRTYDDVARDMLALI